MVELVRFCSNFSRSSFRLCVKSITSADSRSELCGTDTLRPRCVGCNRDFSLRFFKSNLRLPFTPPSGRLFGPSAGEADHVSEYQVVI